MTQLKYALLTLDGHRHLLIMANSLNAQDVHIGIDGPKGRENGQSRLSCLQSHHGGWEGWLRSSIVQKFFLYCWRRGDLIMIMEVCWEDGLLFMPLASSMDVI